MQQSMRLDNSFTYPRKLARAFVYAAMGFDKIGQALTFRLCPSCIPQDPGPFTSGLGVYHVGVSGAEYHDTEWLGLHLLRVGPKAKSRLGVFHSAVETPPSHDDSKNGRQINIHRYAAVG